MRARILVPGLFTLVGLVILIVLGGWQWSRLGQKQALIATITERQNLPPVDFPAAAEWPRLDINQFNYRPVKLTGVFDHGREAHVFFSLSKSVNGVGGPGYLIVTPLMLDGGGTVLVNRGFVPADRKAPATRQAGQIGGKVSIEGLARLPEVRGTFSAADDSAKNVYFVRDPVALAKALGLSGVAPVMVDLKAPVPPGGLPLVHVTQVDIPNNHLQYALTWWSLAAILAIMFGLYARSLRGLRGSAPQV